MDASPKGIDASPKGIDASPKVSGAPAKVRDETEMVGDDAPSLASSVEEIQSRRVVGAVGADIVGAGTAATVARVAKSAMRVNFPFVHGWSPIFDPLETDSGMGQIPDEAWVVFPMIFGLPAARRRGFTPAPPPHQLS
jgi:hypothetical protein